MQATHMTINMVKSKTETFLFNAKIEWYPEMLRFNQFKCSKTIGINV